MKVDSKLKFSCEKFQETLVGYTPEININNEIMHSPISEPYPSLYVLAQFADIVYNDVGSDAYEKNVSLPDGWKLLTTAYNNGWTNGYFGAAWWSPSLQQVVVSHRGTIPTETGAIFTNLTGVVLKYDSYRMMSAITFVEIVKDAIHKANTSSKRFHLSITGHSLGGWLAQVSGFSVKYLRAEGGQFIKNRDHALHAHIVAFESPGCKNMLDEIVDAYDIRYDRTLYLEALDISIYLSAPNSINTFGLHVGDIYRIMIDVTKFSVLQRFSVKYTLKTHSMKNILAALEDNKTVHRMKDWPLSHKFTSPEYDTVHQEMTKANEFHLDLEEEDKYYMPFHYKVERSDNSGSLRIFSDDELKLLHFLIIFKKETVMNIKMQTFHTKHKLSLFENFTIDINKRTITCESKESLEMVIKRVKLLVRWFREDLVGLLKQQSTEIPGLMYFMENQNYLNYLPKCLMNFRDSIGLRAFLESDAERILHIRTEDSEFEMARLFNVFCQLREQSNLNNLEDYLQHNNHTFIHWKNMATLGSVVDCDKLYETDFTCDNLLVIDCSSSTDISLDLGEKNFLKKFGENAKKKLILVSPRQCNLERFLNSFSVPVKNIHFKHIELIDLTEEAQAELFAREMLAVGGKRLSLADYAGVQNLAHFLPRVNTLIHTQRLKNIVIDQNYTIELKDTLLNHADLRVHSALSRLVNASTVIRNLREHSPGALLVVSSEEQEEMTTETWRDLMAEAHWSTELRVATAEDAEPLFKQLCRDRPDKKIYWLHNTAGLVRCKQMYEKDFYMERKFCNRIVFNFNSTEDFKDAEDILIFQNVSDKKSLMELLLPEGSATDFLKSKNVQTAISAEQVDDIIKRNADKSVHVLKFEYNGGPCIWLRSQGSLEGLRPHVTADTSRSVDEGDLYKLKQKVIIIADEPGMGKSTSLTSMSRQLRSAWVIRINLKDFLIPIQNLPPVLSMRSVTAFLLEGMPTEDSLLQGLLEFCLQHEHSRQVYLLFDGFDEVKEDTSQKKINTKNEVLRLLQYLKNKTIARLWVTTRLHLRKTLENSLAVFAMTFREISEEQQREYVLKFWRSHLLLELDNCGHVEESKLTNGARELYRVAKDVLGRDIDRFMGIPLQTRMLAEVFMQQVKENVGSPVASSFKVESVLDLYQKFVKLKYDIYLNDKTKLNNDLSGVMKYSNVEQITEKHRMVGLLTLFPDFANEYFDDIEDDLTCWEAELCRFGLVQSGGDGRENIEFTHRTLAEYFCADLAVQWLYKKGRYHGHAPVLELLLTKILLLDSGKVMRIFINEILRLLPIPDVAHKFIVSKMCKLWNKTQHLLFNRDLQTALHIAVDEGSEGTVDFLIGGLKLGLEQEALTAFVAAHDKDGDTALGKAAQRAEDQYLSLMKKIVQCVETCTYETKLELLLATYIRKSPPIVLRDYLKEAACSKINSAFIRTLKIIDTVVPLFLTAIRENREEEIDELFRQMENDIEHYYLLLAPDEARNTILHVSVNNEMQTKVIKQYCTQNTSRSISIGRLWNKLGENPLHCAAKVGLLDIVKHFVTRGVKIDSLSVDDTTALSYATQRGNLSVAEFLVEKGANINSIDNIGFTSLMFAAFEGRLPLVKFLLKKGADINCVAKLQCWTALFYAVVSGKIEVLEVLLQEGADINSTDIMGLSPLAHASFLGLLPVVTFLVEKGADINSADNKGLTALSQAASQGRLSVVEYLVSVGADEHSSHGIAVANGVDINSADKNGLTALSHAARGDNLPVVVFLVEKGADINSVDNAGFTALSHATSEDRLLVMEFLVTIGANISSLCCP